MILVIDLEATCEAVQPADHHNQIIEIGAVWLSPSGEVLDKFETLVRVDQPISEFCTGITTITQELSDTGMSFPEASAALAEFASRYPGKTWASWGFRDKEMIERDSAYHRLANPLEGWAHRNLKVEYHAAKPKVKKKQPHVGMKRAMVELGIELEGVHHRALPDALNICKVFTERVRRESWKTDLSAREAARRKAIWKLAGFKEDQGAKMVLLEIERLDRDYPIGPAHSWTLAELAERVPHTPHSGSQSPTFFKVLESDIPEPWRARMNAAGLGAARFPDAFYGVDWLSFLASWEIDTKRPEDQPK
jgi:inhibitor of KinA sporulation pathway (predicted exonuclease)